MPIYHYMRPKGTSAELEARRIRAITLLQEGHPVQKVAGLVGVTREWVGRWRKIHQKLGKEGLRAKPRSGPEPKLKLSQRGKLVKLLLKGPLACGYRTELWTLERVAHLIGKHFKVSYHPGHVWRILRGLRWSCQKPEQRARERDEEAIKGWREKRWPDIKKVQTTAAKHCFC